MTIFNISAFNVKQSCLIGPNSSSKIGEELLGMGKRKALICTDQGIIKTGILDKVISTLEQSKVLYNIYDGVVGNPRIETVEEGLKAYRSKECDCLVAIGGGSSIDTAKAIGIVANNESDIEAYEGFYLVKNDIPPLLAVPTTYGTGSEVTNASVITNSNKKYKMLILDDKLTPTKAILDPLLLIDLPIEIAASTGMDALTHAIESYTANSATVFTDALNIHAIKLISDNLLTAVSTKDITASANMLYASTLTGLAFSNTALGFVHAIAHALGGIKDMPHGMANAILLPHVMEYNLISCLHKFQNIAFLMGKVKKSSEQSIIEDARMAIDAVKELLELLPIPTKLCEFGIKEDNVDFIAECATKDGNFGFNPRSGSKEDIVKIIRAAM